MKQDDFKAWILEMYKKYGAFITFEELQKKGEFNGIR